MKAEFKQKMEEKLLDEKKRLISELESIGSRNPNNPDDWEGRPEDDNVQDSPDLNTRADHLEDYENNHAIVQKLEGQLIYVREALEKIEKDEYGFCEFCHKEISKERLEANPSAKKCVEHM